MRGAESAPTLAQGVLPSAGLLAELDNPTAEHLFAVPASRMDFLRGQTYEQFEAWMIHMNGLCRGIPEQSYGLAGPNSHHSIWQPVNDVHGEPLPSRIVYMPPASADRRGLFRAGFHAAQQLSTPLEAGALLGVLVNEVHAFEDGNGRLARFMGAVFVRGFDGSPENKRYYTALLENNAGRSIIDLKPVVETLRHNFAANASKQALAAQNYTGPMVAGAGLIRESLFPKRIKGLRREAFDNMRHMLGESEFNQVLITKFTGEMGWPLSQFIIQSPYTDTAWIDVNTFAGRLTKADIPNLALLHQRIKREYVEAVIDTLNGQSQYPLVAAEAVVAPFLPLQHICKATGSAALHQLAG